MFRDETSATKAEHESQKQLDSIGMEGKKSVNKLMNLQISNQTTKNEKIQRAPVIFLVLYRLK